MINILQVGQKHVRILIYLFLPLTGVLITLHSNILMYLYTQTCSFLPLPIEFMKHGRCEKPHVEDSPWDVNSLGQPDGLTLVMWLQFSELFQFGLKDVGDLHHYGRSLLERHPWPSGDEKMAWLAFKIEWRNFTHSMAETITVECNRAVPNGNPHILVLHQPLIIML